MTTLDGGATATSQVTYAAVDECTAVTSNVVVVVSLRPPTDALTRATTAAARALNAKHGATAVLVLIDAGHGPPDEAGRARIRRLAVELQPVCAGLSCHVEGQGFVAASKRSVLTLVSMVAKGAVPIKVFGSGLEAAEWAARRAGPPSQGPALWAAAESLRERLVRGGLRAGD